MGQLSQHCDLTMGRGLANRGLTLCMRIFQLFYVGYSKNNVSYPEEPLNMKKKLRGLKKLLTGNTTQLLLNYYQENTFAKTCYSLMHLICTY